MRLNAGKISLKIPPCNRFTAKRGGNSPTSWWHCVRSLHFVFHSFLSFFCHFFLPLATSRQQTRLERDKWRSPYASFSVGPFCARSAGKWKNYEIIGIRYVFTSRLARLLHVRPQAFVSFPLTRHRWRYTNRRVDLYIQIVAAIDIVQ